MKPTRINSLGFSPLAARVRLRKIFGTAMATPAARPALLAVRRNSRREKEDVFDMSELSGFQNWLSTLLDYVFGHSRRLDTRVLFGSRTGENASWFPAGTARACTTVLV